MSATVLSSQGRTVSTFQFASSIGAQQTGLVLPCHCSVCKLDGKAGG